MKILHKYAGGYEICICSVLWLEFGTITNSKTFDNKEDGRQEDSFTPPNKNNSAATITTTNNISTQTVYQELPKKNHTNNSTTINNYPYLSKMFSAQQRNFDSYHQNMDNDVTVPFSNRSKITN